jgi:HEAT repeat protein
MKEFGWERPCEQMFKVLLQSAPSALVQLLEEGVLAPADLTYAAEAAGQIRTTEAVFALLNTLGHPSALVREGAIYGLAQHRDDSRVDPRLQRTALHDLDVDVRAAATDVLAAE